VALLTYGAWYRNRHQRCPDCISTVPSEARVCRYCGYQFKERADPVA
jgi:ribosomal protein L40E